MRSDGETIELGGRGHLSTGQLAHVLRGKTPLHRQLRQRLHNGDWFVDAFPGVLSQVAGLRNPGVHQAHIGRDEVIQLRNLLVGVGCQGALIELAKVRPTRA